MWKKRKVGTKGSGSNQSSSKLAAGSSEAVEDSMNLDEIKTGNNSIIFIYKKLRAFSDSGNNSKLSYNFVCLGSYTITAYSQINFLPAAFIPYNNQEELSNHNTYNDDSDVDRIFLNTGQESDDDYSIEYKKVD